MHDSEPGSATEIAYLQNSVKYCSLCSRNPQNNEYENALNKSSFIFKTP